LESSRSCRRLALSEYVMKLRGLKDLLFGQSMQGMLSTVFFVTVGFGIQI
jgi:hypothetical protein